MKHLQKFETHKHTVAEFIFKCSSTWVGTEIEVDLYDFTEE